MICRANPWRVAMKIRNLCFALWLSFGSVVAAEEVSEPVPLPRSGRADPHRAGARPGRPIAGRELAGEGCAPR